MFGNIATGIAGIVVGLMLAWGEWLAAGIYGVILVLCIAIALLDREADKRLANYSGWAKGFREGCDIYRPIAYKPRSNA